MVRILLTNDDGVKAEGIRALHAQLRAEFPKARLLVVAPDRDNSSTAHSTRAEHPVKVTEVKLADGTDAYAVDGTPVDCVRLVMGGLVPNFTPDLVVAGINNGSNVGQRIILYSGTLNAALEGVMLGVPSLAVSQSIRNHDFNDSARFTAALVRRIYEASGAADPSNFSLLSNFLVSVGYPGLNGDAPNEQLFPKGVEVTFPGQRAVEDETISEEVGDQDYSFVLRHHSEGRPESGTDFAALRANKISVSPYALDWLLAGSAEGRAAIAEHASAHEGDMRLLGRCASEAFKAFSA